MDKLQALQKTSEITISTTLYRSLFLLKLLQTTQMSIPEIKQACAKDRFIGSKLSDDTIRMTITTLKSVGCVFSKPSVKNNFCYKIIKSPFRYDLEEKDIKFLSQIREELAPFVSWENLSKINDLYEKMNNEMNEGENKFDLSKQSIFLNVNLEILKQLEDLCEKKVFTNILYKSKGILKNINVVPYFLKYENEYVYLWCYNESHETFSFLRADRIKKINNTMPEKETPEIKTSKVTLFVENTWLDLLKLKYKTTVLEKQEKGYIVEVEYLSEFHIIQTILELSPYCKVLEPSEIKEKIIRKLEAMRKLYTE